MTRLELIQRVRSNTRDLSNSIFREQDIIDYLNEGVQRFRQVIPEFDGLTPLLSTNQVPTLIPEAFHHLLAVYSSSKCFAQDERFYQATTLMNEFEVKLQELVDKIESGLIIVNTQVLSLANEYIDLSYFDEDSDVDLGVEGVV